MSAASGPGGDDEWERRLAPHEVHYVLFFNSEETGRMWAAKHANTFLLTVTEAYEVGTLTNKANFGEALAGSPRSGLR